MEEKKCTNNASSALPCAVVEKAKGEVLDTV